MDHELFTSLLQSLLQIGVVSFPEDGGDPGAFSEKYCYNSILQPCFTADELTGSVRALENSIITDIHDELGIRILLFRLGGRVYILGPFVAAAFDEKKTREVLIAKRLPASFLPSVRLYYSAFPPVSRHQAMHTIKALVQVLFPSEGEYSYRHRSTEVPPVYSQQPAYSADFDYDSVYKRYELENRFLKMIEDGDTEHVISAFQSIGISELNSSRYINAIYFRPEVSFAMVRALSRKAAERGGASVMDINEITQRSLQNFISTSSFAQAGRHINSMVLELTEAVRRQKEEGGRYSAPIRKVVSYLRYNYSQEISLAKLAKTAAMAPSYLSRQFKEETGMTISETIRRMRCDQAARLLKETGISIAEISSFVGYQDSNYFVKVFKKTLGKTPSEFRKQN